MTEPRQRPHAAAHGAPIVALLDSAGAVVEVTTAGQAVLGPGVVGGDGFTTVHPAARAALAASAVPQPVEVWGRPGTGRWRRLRLTMTSRLHAPPSGRW